MADSEYEWGFDYVQDILIQVMLNDNDLLDPDILGGVNNIILNYLYANGVSEADAKFFDVIVEKEDVKFTLKAGNIVSGMWLSGFFPENPNLLFDKNRAIFDGKIFTFNKKTKKFGWTEK